MVEMESDSRTPATILNRVRDPRDHHAWQEFFTFCDGQFRKFSRQLRLDFQTGEEIRCEAWDSLWKKMSTFQYDTGKRFRHWLYIFYQCRVRDHLKAQGKEHDLLVDFSDPDIQHLLPPWNDRPIGELVDFEVPEAVRGLLKTAEEVQEAVRSKGKESTWRAYWMVEIEGMSVAEAAKELGTSCITTHKKIYRIKKKLIEEGRRRLDGDNRQAPGS